MRSSADRDRVALLEAELAHDGVDVAEVPAHVRVERVQKSIRGGRKPSRYWRNCQVCPAWWGWASDPATVIPIMSPPGRRPRSRRPSTAGRSSRRVTCEPLQCSSHQKKRSGRPGARAFAPERLEMVDGGRALPRVAVGQRTAIRKLAAAAAAETQQRGIPLGDAAHAAWGNDPPQRLRDARGVASAGSFAAARRSLAVAVPRADRRADEQSLVAAVAGVVVAGPWPGAARESDLRSSVAPGAPPGDGPDDSARRPPVNASPA